MFIKFIEKVKDLFEQLPHDSGKKLVVIEDKLENGASYFEAGIIKIAEMLGIEHEIINVNTSEFFDFCKMNYMYVDGVVVVDKLKGDSYRDLRECLLKNPKTDIDNFLGNRTDCVIEAVKHSINELKLDLNNYSNVLINGANLGFKMAHALNCLEGNRPAGIMITNSNISDIELRDHIMDADIVFNFLNTGAKIPAYYGKHIHKIIFDVSNSCRKVTKQSAKNSNVFHIINVSEFCYYELFKRLLAR